jgi:hypothetical protein
MVVLLRHDRDAAARFAVVVARSLSARQLPRLRRSHRVLPACSVLKGPDTWNEKICAALHGRGRRRCRLHGGLSPGAPRGAKNGNFRNGNWTADAIEERRWLRCLVNTFAKNGVGE